MEDDDRPPIAPFALNYRRPQASDGMRSLARIAIPIIRIASVVFTVAGFGMMITALFVGELAGWGTGMIGATLLIAGGIFITVNHYIIFWAGPIDG
jgi:hypothetical protein